MKDPLVFNNSDDYQILQKVTMEFLFSKNLIRILGMPQCKVNV